VASYVRRLPAGTALYARPWPEMARKALGHHYGCDPARSADRSGFMGSRPSQQALCINCCGLSLGLWLEKEKTNFVASRMPIPIGIDIEVRYGTRRRGEPNLGLVLGGKVSD
jgi:hypothetical protein